MSGSGAPRVVRQLVVPTLPRPAARADRPAPEVPGVVTVLVIASAKPHGGSPSMKIHNALAFFSKLDGIPRHTPQHCTYDDPAAPPANSLVVAVAAVVLDNLGRVLMIQRTDNGMWAVPGGAQEVGETCTEAAIREVREETGLDVEVTGLVGIFSDPRHVIAYDDGEVRQEFSICFHAHPIGGRLTPSSESKQVHWVEPDYMDKLNIHPSVRFRIEHGLQRRPGPYLS